MQSEEYRSQIQKLDQEMRGTLARRAGLVEALAEAEGCGESLFAGFTPVEILESTGARIVYQGVEGAYSHQALLRFFGEKADAFPVATFEAAVAAVYSGKADYGVLPIENTTGGAVGDVLDLLIKYGCSTVAELDLPIQHVLLGLPGSTLEGIRTVYSHPQGFLQCSRFLEAHTGWNRIPLGNTAASARQLLEEGDPARAAIASELCARLYGLVPLAEEIADNLNNTTRFIILSNRRIYRRDARRISLCFECRHEAGALYRLLSYITFHGLNMTKIESRPLPGRNFEYRFFIDLEGNLADHNVRSALAGITAEAGFCRILGNF